MLNFKITDGYLMRHLQELLLKFNPKIQIKCWIQQKSFNLDVEVIGEIGGDEVKINDILLSLDKVKNLYFETFVKKVIQ